MTSTFQLCKDCTRAIPAKYQTCTEVPGNTRCEGDCVEHEELLDRPVPTVTTEALPNGARKVLTTDKCKRYLCEKLGGTATISYRRRMCLKGDECPMTHGSSRRPATSPA